MTELTAVELRDSRFGIRNGGDRAAKPRRFWPALVLLGAVLVAAPGGAAAQDEEASPYKPIFDGALETQIANVCPSANALGKNVLMFRVTHRFVESLNHSTGHDGWSLDSGANVGLGFTYGLTSNLEAGVYRTSYFDDYEGHLKFRWFAQAEAFPLSISTKIGGNYLSERGVQGKKSGGFAQLILQRRFGPFVFVAAPTYETNTTSFEKVSNVIAGFQWDLPEGFSVGGEVVPRNRDNPKSTNAWAFTIVKRVPGHSFAIVLGNSRATTVDMAVASDFPEGFRSDDIRIGFNITRRWRF